MGCIILTHLGNSIPPYIIQCVHQLRLWNPDLTIYLILDSCHRGCVSYSPDLFQKLYSLQDVSYSIWHTLETKYKVKLVYTDTLVKTNHHTFFVENLKSEDRFDLKFRKGYWQFVKERFFYIEELIQREGLIDSISMEYDVLVYVNLDPLFKKLRASHQTLRFVKDNEKWGNPALLYLPNLDIIHKYNEFLVTMIHCGLSDMDCLVAYEKLNPTEVHYFPCLTKETTLSKPNRVSVWGHTTTNPAFLYEDASYFGCVFDSLAVGQWVGGVDPRNTGGQKVTRHVNEGTLYTVNEVGLEWVKIQSKWVPIFDGCILATIHVHSKALSHLLSDKETCPSDEYDVNEVMSGLVPNE